MIFKIIPNGKKKCIQKKTDDFNYYSTLNENRILDLSKYDSLKKRDAEWLIQIKKKPELIFYAPLKIFVLNTMRILLSL